MIEISEILYRWSKNLKIKEISRSLGYARNSVRSIIREAQDYGLIPSNESEQIDRIAAKIQETRYSSKTCAPTELIAATPTLAIYDERISGWLAEKSMTITQIYRLIEESGYKTSETSIRRYIHANFKSLIKSGKNYTVPLFTKPGEEAQVDYGYVGLMKDNKTGKLRKTYAFVMTMSYSRYRYVEFSFTQEVKSWIQSHINAFKFFGGVPKTILLDNLKSGVIKADIYDPTINKSYAELERFYGFIVDPAKVRTPQHKGKVERSVLIVKQQLIAGRSYTDVQEANRQAHNWCVNIIAKKVTRTTGKTPEELFAEERGMLLKLPASNFDISEWVTAKVHKDHHVVFKGNFYSAPTCYIGLEVAIKSGFKTLEIYYDNKLIKAHLKLAGKGNWQTDKNDYPESVLRFLDKTPEKCLEEAQIIGEATMEIIRIILAKPSKQRLRKAQAIIRLKEKYGEERLEKACLRAFIYENYCYEAIRNCLEKNLESAIPQESPELIYRGDGAYLRPENQYASSMEAHYG